ncbi:uncharacterized protein LOC133903574 [Phragmites australis]|uniref:uncharacterized protein LOC133903574 n=1 Tax=Phragmites australis TaxID=29695 RepID=UPI002D775B0C|nr:uncharacterized protein LOC133903574 [Phragmites australis]
MNSLRKATAVAAVVTVLAATAVSAGSYISKSLSAGFLSFPPFLWVAANLIVLWLLSSSRRSRTAAASSSAGLADDVLNSVDDLYPSSEYEGFSDVGRHAGAKRQGREARTSRRTDRAPRLRKKSAGEEEKPRTVAAEASRPDGEKRGVETHGPVATVGTKPVDGDDDDVSLDSLWQSIVQRRAARPVAVRKSDTWVSDVLPRLQRAAETAVARREMRKSVSAAAPPPPPQAAPSAARQLGWRTRDVLVMAQDELLRRAESLIRRHHAHLRLQRQESELRQAMELQRGRPAATTLIRV